VFVKQSIAIFLFIFSTASFSFEGELATPTRTPDPLNPYGETMKKHCESARLLYAAYDSSNFSYIKKMASENMKDPFIFPACQLLEYSAKLITPKELVDAFPDNQKDFEFFSAVSYAELQSCKLFGKDRLSEPLFTYYDVLFNLMGQGNRPAMEKVSNTFSWIDGRSAEFVQWTELPDFAEKHPDLILNNWDLFKGQLDLEGFDNLSHFEKEVRNASGNKTAKREFLKEIERMESLIKNNP
jgi:hypothetical protein